MAVRMGVLGAARIAPQAVVKPARAIADVDVVAVAARDKAKADRFATKHGIGKVHESYASLLEDPDIDAVYNPLPNGLHGHWSIAALQAGKHVLCEKPFTANAREAREVAAVAARTGLVCMEAFHYRYHPLMGRLLEIVNGGELGTVRRIETWMCIPLLPPGDIRWQLGLAGGTLMDVGCYTIHMLRTLAGAEPSVGWARARLRSAGVDRFAEASMTFADGRTGHITASMLSHRLVSLGVKVIGDDAELRVLNPTVPQLFHRVTVRSGGRRRHEKAPRTPTYQYQLQAFADAVLHGAPVLTGPDDAIANMEVIDAVYRAAGLEARQPTPA